MTATAMDIYRAYPRHVAVRYAIECIEKAIKRGNDPDWLLERARLFAESPAGHRGIYTPHPSTWFNQERYHDDDSEWFMGEEADRPKPMPSGLNIAEWRKQRGLEA